MPLRAVSQRLQVFISFMDEEGFGVFGAPDRTFGAPGMVSVDLRLTDSAATTSGSDFFLVLVLVLFLVLVLVLVLVWIMVAVLLTLPFLVR